MTTLPNVPRPGSVRIVLCSTTHAGNIGASARAMKTMGLADLFLVQPRHFPADEATARAVGAADLLDRARVCEDLDQALDGCAFVVGMTARRRDLSHDVLSLRAAALRTAQELATAAAHPGAAKQAAFVFGTEMSGLSNAELERCSVLANIPTDPDFGSLNLGAAVQLACYELRQAMHGDQPFQPFPQPMARHEDVEALFAHLERTLQVTGFLRPDRPKRLMERLRRLLTRTRLEHEEVSMLRGLLRAFELTLAGSSPEQAAQHRRRYRTRAGGDSLAAKADPADNGGSSRGD